MVTIPALAELLVGGYRIGGPSLWRDEGYTIVGSRRPVGAIWTLVKNQDAVHGPYYLLMHFVIAAGGISATALRLPSLIAMCLAAALTAAVGRRLAAAAGLPAPSATGLVAGLLLTAVPLTTRYAQEARTYGLTMLFAVLATYLLTKAATSRRWAWWAGYALALTLVGMFSILAVLLAVAHGLSLAAARRTGPDLATAGLAGAVPGVGGVSAGDLDLDVRPGAGTSSGADRGDASLRAAGRDGADLGPGGVGDAGLGSAEVDGAGLGSADVAGGDRGADRGGAVFGSADVGGDDLGADIGSARRDRPGSSGGSGAGGVFASLGGAISEDAMTRWLMACGAAVVLLAPMIILTVAQSSQVNWITTPDLSTVATLVRDFAGGVLLIPVVGLLAVLGCVAGTGFRRGSGLTVAVVTVPWLVLPPVLLLAVSLARPVYVERYVVFCLPALSVLSAVGLTWLVELTRSALRERRIFGGRSAALAVAPSVLLAAIVLAALIGPQRAVRLATARVDNLRAVAATIAANERSGDAIVYLPWDTRPVGMVYPGPFLRLRDIELGASPIASATLRGLEAPATVVAARFRGVRRVWTVQWAQQPSPGGRTPTDVAATTAIRRMRLIRRWQIASVLLSLYTTR
jgi:mannosyltransferase